MRIDNWHSRKLASDPEYAKAVELVDLSETIADLVVRMRIRSGLSQADVARRASTTQAAISRLENGEGNPSVDLVRRVMSALIDFAVVPATSHATAVPAGRHANVSTVVAVNATIGWEPFAMLPQWMPIVPATPVAA